MISVPTAIILTILQACELRNVLAFSDDQDEDEDVEVVVAVAQEAPDNLDSGPAPVSPAWRKLWRVYCNNRGGLEKLQRDRPSTGFFGNWGIVAAAKRISEWKQVTMHATLFMGKGVRGASIPVRLLRKDSPETVQQQWEALRNTFNKPKQVLLYHLKNHYALVYALREWQPVDGEPVRQILTARKGQRPSAWIDFAEARDTMIKWSGYKILLLTMQ
eukprot:TRINITY_DN10399_c1_g3_i1.p1 TRINITY_DN10399_c1_g3~~TRINITY_DN10399_c1_g3_i1.p1  ORF type:complete len:217 (+),score=52.05 TRINITY_DN10399_c1_g3_i1:826-1476(+)